MFAFTGCADYESDINSLNERLDELETGQIASLEEQIATLSSALEDAKTAITALEGSTSDLETAKEDLLSQIEELNKKIEENDGDIATLISQVAELEAELARIDGLEKDLEALKKTVEEIENNYLTKEEAQNTYATLKAVADLESALSGVEGRVDNLETVELPAVKNAIEAAQKDASEALGNIDALVEALGGYSEAGTLNKIDDLDAVDSTLKANIEALNDSLKANVEALREEIASTKEEILSLVVSKEELPALVEEQIRKAIEEENGRINQAISDAIKEVTNNLMSQIEDLSDRLEDVEAAMEDLTKRIEAAEGEIDDLANRIQSLVFVPEYNDGKATVLSYTINGTPVSDNMVVTATFQVTPAALAENVINQYEDYVFAYVLPVLTRSSADIAYVASAENSSLVLKKGKRDGFVDVEITVPTKTEDGIELAPGGFAVSLYVASKEEVKAVVEGEETVVDMDAGTYVTSDYVQTAAGKATELDNAYVLYNEIAKKEYPTATSGELFVEEVNSYERAWSVMDRAVILYGDNNYDDVDDGAYTLHIKLNDEYYTLEEAAELMRADVEDITPAFSGVNGDIQYYRKGESRPDAALAEYFKISENEEFESLIIDMAKTSEMAEIIGSYVLVGNEFSFDAESKYGECEVLQNIGRYEVINLPVEINLNPLRIDWTYDFALAHADDAANPTVANDKPIAEEDWTFTIANQGTIAINEALAYAVPTIKVYSVKNGTETEIDAAEAPALTFDWANGYALTDETNGTIDMSIENYEFDTEDSTVYRYEYSYFITKLDTECTLNFTLTFGEMPGDLTVDYVELPRLINFMLPGSGLVDSVEIEDGYAKAFAAVNENQKWFTGLEQFTGALQLNDVTLFTTKRDGTPIYNEAQITETSPVHTRLTIEPDADVDGSYVRVSSSQITSVNNVFEFTTEIETWYGATYTFINKGSVAKPEYTLEYIPTNVHDYDKTEPYVQLTYDLENGIYNIQDANLDNYFRVENLNNFNGELTVKFKTLTQENAAEGYSNIPVIDPLLVNNTNGTLTPGTINWGAYDARNLQIRAILVGSGNADVTEEVVIDSLDLRIQVDPIIESFGMKEAGDTDYNGNEITTDAAEFINYYREDNSTVTINLWEYLKAIANPEFGNGENFIPYELDGERLTNLDELNDNPAMMMYGAEIEFTSYTAEAGGKYVILDYNEENGTITYKAEDGEIANPIYITVTAVLHYYLDYSDVIDANSEGEVAAMKTQLKIKLQDIE